MSPTLGTRCGYRKRGSSSGGFPKYAMALESWNEFDEDVDIKPLGFSAEGDWILNSRYTFDQSLMRNPFLYALSNQIDRWAVKTQFIEIFHDATGGDITSLRLLRRLHLHGEDRARQRSPRYPIGERLGQQRT